MHKLRKVRQQVDVSINSSKVYCKYGIGRKTNYNAYSINSSKVYCKWMKKKLKNLDSGVLIVAKCIVNETAA